MHKRIDLSFIQLFLEKKNSEHEYTVRHLPLNGHAEMFFQLFQNHDMYCSYRMATLVTKSPRYHVKLAKVYASLSICYFYSPAYLVAYDSLSQGNSFSHSTPRHPIDPHRFRSETFIFRHNANIKGYSGERFSANMMYLGEGSGDRTKFPVKSLQNARKCNLLFQKGSRTLRK